MKSRMNIFLMVLGLFVAAGFTSCSDDDFTATIFDTTDYPLDRTSYTFPLDSFCKKEFLQPYNLQFIYKMEDKASDMNKNLTPARYDKSVDLAVLTKYLWYDVYKLKAGETFLKKYTPRIIHVVGSKNYNPTSGTETLGDASSGVKINLYNVNQLNVNDIDNMNEYFFHTMHHEFSHILDQTHLHPLEFNIISNSHYDASNWQHTPDSISAGLGFVSPYASMAYSEDWAETISSYITYDTVQWVRLLGSASYEWESFDISDEKAYNDTLRIASANGTRPINLDTIGYFYQPASGTDCKLYRRACQRNANGSVALDKDGNVVWLHTTGLDGRATILQKLELARNYLKTYYNIDIDDIRREVQARSYVKNADGTFAFDRYGMLINRLTQPDANGKTLIDALREEVTQYDSLRQ